MAPRGGEAFAQCLKRSRDGKPARTLFELEIDARRCRERATRTSGHLAARHGDCQAGGWLGIAPPRERRLLIGDRLDVEIVAFASLTGKQAHLVKTG